MKKDWTGMRFGRLTVVKLTDKKDRGNRVWLCVCDCGRYKEVRSSPLGSGGTKSCGCLLEEHKLSFGDRIHKHGHTARNFKSPEYSTWSHMKSRCQDVKHERYADWGGRGIKVCERWQVFENFLKDMGPRPEGTTLGRIDKNDDYYLENCRWMTPKEQQANTRKQLRLQDRNYVDEMLRRRAEKKKEYDRGYYKSHQGRMVQKASADRAKADAIRAYGGYCACCGEDQIEFLTLDHINNDGGEQRRNGFGGGQKLYRRLRREGFPKGEIQVLCFNCNCSKGIFGYCPHQMDASRLLFGTDVSIVPVTRTRIFLPKDLPIVMPPKHHRAKLTREEEFELLNLYTSRKCKIDDIAMRFDISNGTVYNILHRIAGKKRTLFATK